MQPKHWYVYMLRCADGTLYTGMTDDLEKRLGQHNTGRGAKYTRGRGPVALAYWEYQPEKAAALRREAQLKKYTKLQKEGLCAAFCSREAWVQQGEQWLLCIGADRSVTQQLLEELHIRAGWGALQYAPEAIYGTVRAGEQLVGYGVQYAGDGPPQLYLLADYATGPAAQQLEALFAPQNAKNDSAGIA